MIQKREISICVCTFRRPRFLERLLMRLQKLQYPPNFIINIIIVDNDDQRSGLQVVNRIKSLGGLPIEYHHEPERSIALARNRAVANACGELVAFIDDDEFPDPNWLLELTSCFDRYMIDGVLGPVIPHFENDPPKWVKRGKLCERPSHPTGVVIDHDDMRTGNALLKRSLFLEDEFPFDPKWGTIGGGDTDFFERMVSRGKKFIWCNEGFVYETVPQERLRRSYFIRRALARGLVNSKKAPLLSLATAKSLAGFLLYTPVLPLALLLNQQIFMKFLISDCDHIGRLLGLIGINPVKERPYESLREG